MGKDIVLTPGRELPSQAAWDEMVQAADTIQILEDGMLMHHEGERIVGRPVGTKVLFESRRREDLESLRACVRFREDTKGGHCMCWGTLAFVFFRDEKRLAVLGFHHGLSFRWDRWLGDGQLLENQGILDWLSERGINGPAQEVEQMKQQQALAEQQYQRWCETLPLCLEPFEPEIRSITSQRRSMLQQAIEEAHPNPQERTRLLCAWYGHGVDTWARYPSYEAEPRMMLDRIPVEVLIQALDGVELSTEELEGAARYFSDWHFQKRFGAAWKCLPPPLSQRLLEYALQTETEPENASFLPSKREIAFRAFTPRT